jgi:hypothetical protein
MQAVDQGAIRYGAGRRPATTSDRDKDRLQGVHRQVVCSRSMEQGTMIAGSMLT